MRVVPLWSDRVQGTVMCLIKMCSSGLIRQLSITPSSLVYREVRLNLDSTRPRLMGLRSFGRFNPAGVGTGCVFLPI